MDRELEAVTRNKTETPKKAPLRIVGEVGEAPGRPLARAALHPSVNAAIAVTAVHKTAMPDLDINELVNELTDQARNVSDGNMARVEAVLTTQLHTLDAMFSALLQRALAQNTLQQYEAHMRFALRAQSQARATAEAIGQIKNPAVVIARQANIGENVQVNNGGHGPPRELHADGRGETERFSSAYARAKVGAGARGETEIERNGLLEASDGARMDTRAAGTAGRGDPAMAAVDALDRAEDRRR